MRSLASIDALAELRPPIHLAIGVFDGVHLGHEAVLGSARAQAERDGGTAVGVTFDPHPAEVLAPERAPLRLTDLAHQRHLFARLGLEAMLAIPFDRQMAAQPAAAFMERLTRACPLASVHVGLDWTFGNGREGNVTMLRAFGEGNGFTVESVAPVLCNGERISSSAVRQAVIAGELEKAKALLGREFSLYGRVVRGDQLGRRLGFPTANVSLGAAALPPHGVYVVCVPTHGGAAGVANLGVRPSVGGEMALRFEVHLFDWAEDLYGQELEVAFLHRLRAEERFEDLESLRGQIERDLESARDWLASRSLV